MLQSRDSRAHMGLHSPLDTSMSFLLGLLCGFLVRNITCYPNRNYVGVFRSSMLPGPQTLPSPGHLQERFDPELAPSGVHEPGTFFPRGAALQRKFRTNATTGIPEALLHVRAPLEPYKPHRGPPTKITGISPTPRRQIPNGETRCTPYLDAWTLICRPVDSHTLPPLLGYPALR